MANGGMSLSDLAQINRARGEYAVSGMAGEPDIPALYALRLLQEGGGAPIASSGGAPFAEPGGGDVIPGLSLGVGASGAAPGAGTGAGTGAGGPVTLASLGGQASAPSIFPRGGEGNRRGTDTSQPAALDPSDPFQSFMESYFGAIKDPTLMARLNPLTGTLMDVTEELQQEDYLGALKSLGLGLGPAALSGLFAGLTFGPEVVAPAAAQQLQPGSPLSVIEMVLSRSQGGRDQGGFTAESVRQSGSEALGRALGVAPAASRSALRSRQLASSGAYDAFGGRGGDRGARDRGIGDRGRGTCFVGDTPILMADGSRKRIRDIAPGDAVMAFDGLGDLQTARVAAVSSHARQRPILLQYGAGEVLTVTRNHPVMVEGGEFMPVGDLRPGMKLVRADGTLCPVLGIHPPSGGKRNGVHTVYNFTVEGLHTYVAKGIRVHNKDVA